MVLPIVPLLSFVIACPEQLGGTEEERNAVAVFSEARLGVVHIKARHVESTEFGVQQHSESTGSGLLIDLDGHTPSRMRPRW